MKVAYVGGFWATNVGNSFYDLGALALLESVHGKENVFFVPDMSKWFWRTKDSFEFIGDLDVDLCLFGGPLLGFALANYEPIFNSLSSRGVKIGFISAGAMKYTKADVNTCLSFLNKFKKDVSFISTRDRQSYELIKESGFNVFDGICCSMFLDWAYTPPSLDRNNYVVYNFAKGHEPRISRVNEDFHIKKRTPFSFQKNLDDCEIVRTQSGTFSSFSKRVFDRPNTYYSDIPFGYLAIYKGAQAVFSDRVHTCAATLVFGGSAMYIKGARRSHDGRNNLFERLGVKGIFDRPVRLNADYISGEKQKMHDFLIEQLG